MYKRGENMNPTQIYEVKKTGTGLCVYVSKRDFNEGQPVYVFGTNKFRSRLLEELESPEVKSTLKRLLKDVVEDILWEKAHPGY